MCRFKNGIILKTRCVVAEGANGGITISCITHKNAKKSKTVRFGQHSVVAWKPLPLPYQPKGE